jgi:hypothetical protein
MLIPYGVVSKTPEREVNMSTSLFYHAFSISGYEYVCSQYQNG